MDKSVNFIPAGPERIAYVRPVDIAELPKELQVQAEGIDNLYSVHDQDGARLAVVHGRKLAFVLARQNDLAPVNVH